MKFKAKLREILGRLSGLISGLPKEDQLEKDTPAHVALCSVRTAGGEIEKGILELESLIDEADKIVSGGVEITDEIRARVLSEACAAGTHLTKADADAATQTAVTARETALKGEFETLRQQETLAAERRNHLAETCSTDAVKLGTDIFASVPVETLAAATFETDAAKIKERLAKVTGLGVTVPAVLSEVAGLALDADGDAAFTAKVSSLEAVAAQFRGGSPQPGRTPLITPKNPGEAEKPKLAI